MFIFQELKGVLCIVPEIVELVWGEDAEQFSFVDEQDGQLQKEKQF